MSTAEQISKPPLDVNMMFRGGEWPPVTEQPVIDFASVDLGVEMPPAPYEAPVETVGRFTRARNYLTDLRHRVGNVLAASKEDYQDSDHKIRALAIGAAVVATEAFDRARSMVFLVPYAATEVLEKTASPTQAAIVGASILSAWNLVTSEVLIAGLKQLPNTQESFKENFPIVVESFRDALPGANNEVVKAEKEAESKSLLRRIGGFSLRHTGRGGTGIAIGTTAFVATSSIDGASTRETREQYLGVSADVFAVAGLTIFGIGQAIYELPKHGQADAAEFLYDRATDMKTWGVIAIGTMILQYSASRRLKKEALLNSDNVRIADREELQTN